MYIIGVSIIITGNTCINNCFMFTLTQIHSFSTSGSRLSYIIIISYSKRFSLKQLYIFNFYQEHIRRIGRFTVLMYSCSTYLNLISIQTILEKYWHCHKCQMYIVHTYTAANMFPNLPSCCVKQIKLYNTLYGFFVEVLNAYSTMHVPLTRLQATGYPQLQEVRQN